MHFQLLEHEFCQPVPWKNLAGEAVTLATYPADAGIDDFDWRVSTAQIDQAVDYSLFPGVDRTQILLAGHGLRLKGRQVHDLLTVYAAVDFDGESPVRCDPIEGACRVMNIMVRRRVATAGFELLHGSGLRPLTADHHLFYVAQGQYVITSADIVGEICMEAGDALLINHGNKSVQASTADDGVLIDITLRTER
jgi:uncharacterized protein